MKRRYKTKKRRAPRRKSHKRRVVKRRSTKRIRRRRSATKGRSGSFKKDNGLMQWTESKSKLTLGSKRNFISKVVRANLQKNIWRFSGINVFENSSVPPLNQINAEVGGGAYWLHHQNGAGAIGTQTLYLPLHLFDITCTPNIVNGSIKDPNPMWQCCVTATNQVLWDNAATVDDPTSTFPVTGAWQAENLAGAAIASTLSVPNRKTFMESVAIKMLLYGARTLPTKFTIDFIQLKQDWLHPEFMNNNTLGVSSTTGVNYRDEACAFWEYLAKEYCGHPINFQNPTFRKYYKVLKSQSVMLQPQLTVSTDVSYAHHQSVDIFIPINKIMNLDWNEAKGFLPQSTIDDPGTYMQNLGSVSTFVEPRKRIYMMIRGSNYYRTQNSATETLGLVPSYDVAIRQSLINIT